MTQPCASIDIGTHTARLLIAEVSEPQGILKPLIRKRGTIRLSEGFDRSGEKIIRAEAIERTLEVLKDFSLCLEAYNVQSVRAIATGLFREAGNGDELLDLIYESTGIRVRPITGNAEALMTFKGVLSALDFRGEESLIFDLGGGSTEFVMGRGEGQEVKSVPVGAGILTQAYLRSDPPERYEVEALARHVDESLKSFIVKPDIVEGRLYVVGTGGTATTLGAMLHRLPAKDITPDGINGLTLTRAQIETLFDRMKHLSLAERLELPGLDPGRAGVILAGCLIVIRILHFFESLRMTISMSDLLEGLLMDCKNPPAEQATDDERSETICSQGKENEYE